MVIFMYNRSIRQTYLLSLMSFSFEFFREQIMAGQLIGILEN